MRASERECMLALSHARCLKARDRITIAAALRGVEDLRRLALADLCALVGRRITDRSWDPDDLAIRGERTARILARGQIGCLFWGEPDFPHDLGEIYDPPATLFHRGGRWAWTSRRKQRSS